MFEFLIVLVLLLLVLRAHIEAIRILIACAKEKGQVSGGTGLFWFIGLLGSAFLLGLVVCALPDLSSHQDDATIKAAEEELPRI